MNLAELKTSLLNRPELNLAFILPDGRRVAPHFHVTEVGRVEKNFVDCGGTFRRDERYVLQTHVGSSRDDGHRLTAGKLGHILELAQPLVTSELLPVEIEYEDGLISQFSLEGADLVGSELAFRLAPKHTDCLAREKCGIPEEKGEVAAGCGCGPRCC